ncbi:transcriptional regulator, LysR family [Halopseudomonas xinjiangensis]|uniref:Transcriptional regulator, LysR family n=1 Tax=Halopseudomonas xinjiangensis TaxID=487184 RepID=A0A1H1SWQ3_9GAMM|nr:LysR substrate-binding domain-containing protein [Halopseudomonas xinjiangensis]SDS52146.1 transcriptional regulator, LysR family [Halopseudomonas xinjiangensis]
MDRLKAMANFVRIVDCGSLSAAANATGQSVASLVRSLAALERHLNVRLLNRSTRRMALTVEGEEYLGWCRQVLADFDEMEKRLEARDGVIRGLLRITAPIEFGHRYVAPLVNEFLNDNPQVRAELSLSDTIAPLLDERLDLAIRIGHLPDSSLVARHVGCTRLITCASPEYLQAASALAAPASLHEHACITLASQGRRWRFRHGDQEWAETIDPRLTCTQVRAASLACTQNIGVARFFHYQVADELADGRLIRVLSNFEPADIPIQLVYPHSLELSPRVKAFVDWACLQLRQVTPSPTE